LGLFGETLEVMDNKNDQDIDVRSVVEAVSADLSFGAPLYVVESMCMRCQENGTTRFLLTLIPHFRKVLISAFECPHCGERNNEVQFAGEIQPRGCCYNLEVLAGDVKIFDRQVVKSESATIKIPELDFEIPPEAQRGSLSTVEGILARAADELSALQEERKKVDPKTAEAIDQFLSKLRACAKAETSFTFILDDPAGNSFIENPHAPSPDPSLTIKFYERTPEQQATLGYVANPSQAGQSEGSLGAPSTKTAYVPNGTIGATAGHRAIAQSNSTDISDNLFRYSAPEEVTSDAVTFEIVFVGCSVSRLLLLEKIISAQGCICESEYLDHSNIISYPVTISLTGDDFPFNLRSMYGAV
jgi:zinc finger protein